MSKTKSLCVFDRLVWVWDNSIDIVLAFMIEEATSEVDPAWLANWRIWASVADLGVEFDLSAPTSHAVVENLLGRARARVTAHGDFTGNDLASWSVLDGASVSSGFIRGGHLEVDAVLDAVDGISELIAGRFPADPPDGYWLIGAPGGRLMHHHSL